MGGDAVLEIRKLTQYSNCKGYASMVKRCTVDDCLQV